MIDVYSQELAAAWAYFVHLAIVLIPLFIGGSFLVGLLQEYIPPDRLQRILRRYDGGTGNVAAAGMGAITPFCSCSTVPVLAGLLQAGTPLGIAVSFLLASPLVNELAIILLAGLFGLEVTAVYVLFTLAAAVVFGAVVGRLGLEGHVVSDHRPDPVPAEPATDGGDSRLCCDGGRPLARDTGTACGDAVGGDSEVSSGESGSTTGYRSHPAHVRRAAHGAGDFFIDLLPYLVVGMALGALIHGFVPASLVGAVIGQENTFAVPTAAVIGAPIYVSMSAMLPIAATFADQGIPIGTVIAFVIGSAGVSLPNLILLNKLFDRTLLAIYALIVVLTAVAVGLAFNMLLA